MEDSQDALEAQRPGCTFEDVGHNSIQFSLNTQTGACQMRLNGQRQSDRLTKLSIDLDAGIIATTDSTSSPDANIYTIPCLEHQDHQSIETLALAAGLKVHVRGVPPTSAQQCCVSSLDAGGTREPGDCIIQLVDTGD